MLTKYGTDNIIVMILVGIILIAISYIWGINWLNWTLRITGLLLIGFTFLFFRDPDRQVPEKAQKDESYVLAPADAKIMEIIEIEHNDYLKEKAIQISMFLSPLDVHVNRIPADGIIEYFKYFKGQFLAAYKPESSVRNEQTHIGLKNKYGKILFKQIVGVLARRLAWDISEGDTVEAGKRFGMMKFGSRMDVILPFKSKIICKPGDKVVAGETIIAQLPRGGTI